jgi:beta-lactamase superfamily II metal-dependent hydrolase
MFSLHIHVLNVGQGDTLVIEFTENDKKIWGLVDCYESGDETKTSPSAFLKNLERKIKELAFVCLTHGDVDHCQGMLEILKYFNKSGRKIREFWDSGLDKEKLEFLTGRSKKDKKCRELVELYKFVHGEKRGRRIERKHDMEYCHIVREWHHFVEIENNNSLPINGTIHQDVDVSNSNFDRLIIRAFAPDPEGNIEYIRSLGEGKKPKKNILSPALVVMFGDKNILLGGDAIEWHEILEGWKRYCRSEKRTQYFDFIKVSHHGSKNVKYERLWEDFTKKEKTVAVISAGCKGSMPHPDILNAIISACNVKLYCTNLWDFSEISSGISRQNFLEQGCIESGMLKRLKVRLKARSQLSTFLTKGRISHSVFKGLSYFLKEKVPPVFPHYHGDCEIIVPASGDCEVKCQNKEKPPLSFC